MSIALKNGAAEDILRHNFEKEFKKLTKREQRAKGKEGRFLRISKWQLHGDKIYQRGLTSRKKVYKIAKEWDWILHGCIYVARRPDGTYWVFDGGHRVRAALLRDDIDKLPCLVFEMNDVPKEARAFVEISKSQTTVSSFWEFKAARTAGDPAANLAGDLCDTLGLKIVKKAQRQGDIDYIGILWGTAKKDADLASEVLHFCNEMDHGGEAIPMRVYRGLFAACYTAKQTNTKRYKGRNLLRDRGPALLKKYTLNSLNNYIWKVEGDLQSTGEVAEGKAVYRAVNYRIRKDRKYIWPEP